MPLRPRVVTDYRQFSRRTDSAEAIRRADAQRLSDVVIARLLGVSREAVRNARRRHGLPRNDFWSRRRAITASPHWPDLLRPREATILDALWRHGPLTRRQILAAVGYTGVPGGFFRAAGPDGDYLKRLVGLGFVLVGGTRMGPNRPENLYWLSPWITPNADSLPGQCQN